MINIEKLVPSVYTSESRDFQLFCRLLDFSINSVQLDTDAMLNILNPILCKDSFLELLSSYYNYQPKNKLTADDLRKILVSYRNIINNRGCAKGIKKVVELVLNLNDSDAHYDVTIYNKVFDRANNSEAINYYKSYNVHIGVDKKIDTSLASEFLDKVLPVGYTYTFEESTQSGHTTNIETYSSIEVDAEHVDNLAIVSADSLMNEINRVEIISEQDTTDVIWYCNNLSNRIVSAKNVIYNSNDYTILDDGSLFTNGTHTVVSWNTKADGSGISYLPSATISKATVNTAGFALFAIWS